MRSRKKRKQTNKHTIKGRWKLRIFGIILVRVIVLAAIVVGYSLPMPYRIIVPLALGTVIILIETFACLIGNDNKKGR